MLANNLFDAASPAMAWGRRASTTAALTWGYYGGVLITGSPTIPALIPNGTIALTASATNYVELTPATGVVSKNTSGFTSGRSPLYIVTTGVANVTNHLDCRFLALGVMP